MTTSLVLLNRLSSKIIRQLVAKYDVKYTTKTKFIINVIS